MSKNSIYPKIDVNDAIQHFSKFTVSELELLVSQFNTLIAAKKAKGKAKRIEDVTKLIHQSVISEDKLTKYKALSNKLEQGIMTDEEHQIFLQLVQEDEKLRNQRVAYMIELSQLQQVPFTEIREQFGFESSFDV